MPQYERLALLSGNAHPSLAQAIAAHINRQLGQINVSQFRDGESHVQILDDVRGSDLFLIQPTSPSVNQHLMELLVMIDAAKRASAGRITAVLPYYGYARQEKKTNGREPISAKLVANLLTVAGADRILTMDLSAPAIEGFFDIPVDHLSAIPLLMQHVAALQLENVVVVAPDVGAVQRADQARRLLANRPLAILFKDRPEPDEVEVESMVGEVEGCTVLLVDDLISTGNTLIAAAQMLKARGAQRVIAVATHGVFAERAVDNLAASPIERTIVTDTIPLETGAPHIEVVSIAPMLAEVINRIHYGISVSDLIRSIGDAERQQMAYPSRR
ncbi:MAG: ribose-phosphate pyrophosphokinase [Anaerolineales bacterium]|nr:ribose-phosphate pyrophosphokinase [Anaerolineales bacterium]MCB9127533.1 ribose-phosphate pyrophosphokinase [Ardenticatenales bacterium]